MNDPFLSSQLCRRVGCCRMTQNPEGFCERHGGPSESVLCPQAEVELQRVEAMARTLRETGNPEYIGRMHHGLAQVRQAMPDSGGEPIDDPAGGLEHG